MMLPTCKQRNVSNTTSQPSILFFNKIHLLTEITTMKCKHFWHKSTLLLLNITKALKVITIFTLGVTLSTFTYADVILHAFNWKYSEVTKKAQEISNLGYKKVLVSPAYKSTGSEWWARYQPQDLRLIDSPLGNTLDFKEMIDTLKSKNIEVYADIVLNHMANESYIRNDLNYPGQAILNDYSKNIDHVNTLKLFGDLTENYLSSNDFHPAGCITNWGMRAMFNIGAYVVVMAIQVFPI